MEGVRRRVKWNRRREGGGRRLWRRKWSGDELRRGRRKWRERGHEDGTIYLVE